jgi:hypothetical protein
MKRFWVHTVTALTAMGGMALLAPACAHNDSSFFLRAVLAPPQSSTNGCVFTSDQTQAEESSGVLDVGVTNQYFAVFLAGNQIIPQGNQEQLMTETSRIIIQGAVVRIVDLDTGAQLANYTDVESGFVDPSNGTTPGYAPVGFMIVDPDTSATLLNGGMGLTGLAPFESRAIVSYVKAFGTTLGGDYEETNTFGFKITACNGCLIQYTSLDPPACNPDVAPSTTGPSLCYVGEDIPFDCHRCIGDPICLCGQDAPCP